MNLDEIAQLAQPYQEWVQSCCAPIIFPNQEGKTRNGTMTLFRTEKGVFGITNAHVADRITNCEDVIGKRCQVGGAYLDPAKFIGRHSDLDLATFRLSEDLLAQVGGTIPAVAATIETWPRELP